MHKSYPFPLDIRHQYKEISAGQNDAVYEFDVPNGYVAFIYNIANVSYDDTHYLWKIDNELYEKVEREIAPLNNPLYLIKPLVATEKILWQGYNNSDNSLTFEVLCDGLIYFKEE